MTRSGTITVALLCLAFSGVGATAQTIAAGPVEIGFGGRAQIQFNTTTVDEADLRSFADDVAEIPYSTFLTRRIRLTVSIEIEEWITGRIQPDFALGELSLKDAWLNFAFDDAFEMRIGQFKKPFSRIELASTTKYLAIEKALRIRGLAAAVTAAEGRIPLGDPFAVRPILPEEQAILDGLGYLGRDIGVSIHGTVDRVSYAIGAFNGSGADLLDGSEGKSFAGRVAFQPARDAPFSIGASASYHETRFARTIPDSLALLDIEFDVGGFALEADAEWGSFRRAGLHALIEAAIGANFQGSSVCYLQPGILPTGFCAVSPAPTDASFVGAQGFLAWFQPLGGGRVEGIEPLARVSYGDPSMDSDGDEGWLLTPGINLYFFGRNRFMLNWDVFISADEALDTQHSLRAQVNLHF